MAVKDVAWCFVIFLIACQANTINGKTCITKRSTAFRQVCFDYVGCFNNKPPFGNANGDLPASPSSIGAEFRLFTRTNPTAAQTLHYSDDTLVDKSNFDKSKDVKVLIHGFFASADEIWVSQLRDELLKRGDYNVIVVNWKNGAGTINYNQAAANVRVVGTGMWLVLKQLTARGLAWSRVHLMGHSLGAHMSGYIGLLAGGQVGRISGFDPAEPDFECLPPPVRLDATDAAFVDVIHTNGAPLSSGGAGLMQQSGHVDFYLNGGKTQPGCKDGLSGFWAGLTGKGGIADGVACSHSRSHDVYIESINSNCELTAFPCDSWAAFTKGQCTTCGERGCSAAGYDADMFYATGPMYLRTRSAKPYCGYEYEVNVTISGASRSTKGGLSAALHGPLGDVPMTKLTEDNSAQLTVNSHVVDVFVANKEVGPITSVTLRYDRYGGNFFGWGKGEKRVTVAEVVVTSLESGSTYRLCGAQYQIEDTTEEDIKLKELGNCP